MVDHVNKRHKCWRRRRRRRRRRRELMNLMFNTQFLIAECNANTNSRRYWYFLFPAVIPLTEYNTVTTQKLASGVSTIELKKYNYI
jgi:hypothetical protein